MHRKFKAGYFHNNNIKYNKLEYSKTKMIEMKIDEDNIIKTNSKNIYNCSVSNATKKMLAHRDNKYKISDEDYYGDDDNDDY